MLLAEQLVGEARERRKREMDSRERRVDIVAAACFLLVASAILVAVPPNRSVDLPLLIALTAGYALVSRVRFEFADAFLSAEQLVFVPMLLLLPVPYLPPLVALAKLIANAPELTSGARHQGRWITCITDAWFSIGPVLIIGLLAPGEPSLSMVPLYVLAFGAEIAGDVVWSLLRDGLFGRTPVRELVRALVGITHIDAILSPVAFVITLVAVRAPMSLAVIGPLVWLLSVFSRERRERYTATLELNRAYRGTVMLLADVVESEDGYTAEHSRSVVDLAQAVAEELEVETSHRQELEFAALLHDVGKISIPKDILNKPAKLTDEEFELMKTHPIEGQFLLDRVGGLLGRVGEIVRSCHERWDGQGYPDGLALDEIPLASRIVFVCDAYNAMTTDRPYRAAMPRQDAIAELLAHAGSQFDPAIVSALVKVIEEGEPESRPADDVRAVLASVQLPERASAVS
jgi:HD-GYP domain-containing protein (c-di-GMP phosphodiesterase class II)